jgi:hypothetical protein
MNIFTKHPKAIGETYWEHYFYAMGFAGYLFIASISCFIHAIFPFLFKDTASNILCRILKKIKKTDRWEKFEQSIFTDK